MMSTRMPELADGRSVFALLVAAGVAYLGVDGLVGVPIVPGPVGGVLLAGVGGLIWLQAFLTHRKLARIRNLPRARIGSASLGLARLEGRIRQLSASVAPFSGAPAVFWRTEALQYQPATSDDPAFWERIFMEEHYDEAFVLEDESGSIPVVTHGAELLLSACETETFDAPAWAASTGARRVFLANLADVTSRRMSPESQPVRVRELRLEVGATITAVGTVDVASEARLPLISESPPIVYLSAEGAGWPPVNAFRTCLEMFERWMARSNLSWSMDGAPAGPSHSGVGVGWDPIAGSAWTAGRWQSSAGIGQPDQWSGSGGLGQQRCNLPNGIKRQQLIVARGEPDRPFVISARAESLVNGPLLTWMRIEFVLGPALVLWGLLGLVLGILG
jgi:hypothetical protein